MREKQPAAAPLAEDHAKASWAEAKASAVLVLADGTVFEGIGFGATGHAVGEVCFNTAMTGYQEILTDPSYAGQIITFTFPHIGNVGTNDDDIETVNMAATPGARGVVLHTAITPPSNYRARRHLDQWLKTRGVIGLSGIDTRALTSRIRVKGMPNAVIAHEPSGRFDLDALKREAREWPGLVGMDLVPMVTSGQRFTWDETPWEWGKGYGRQERPRFHVVAIDYGIKRNILRQLAGKGCRVTVVPAQTSSADILALEPDGVFLSNGPGDPAATGAYAVPVIRDIIDKGIPTFGICLGHQMLGIAVGAKTVKMHQGHHGANHPVKDLRTGKVEITSMNHGFAVDSATLPASATETHVSLFDGSNCGIALKDKPVFSVQYHPEASPGPRDSHYLFQRFVEMMQQQKKRT
ncbi:MAG TPA: glutamine-hydrolyzing carbamoyl-phosphate synthase small subunit [Xanthobacteraceae bacterium]|jgi:carbamoyl-phosphate synthase small subunit|nr:glutamine-hydrolyzing carbamoyl-phosphate synthase small subunit [Xanthobacteraceae bacterium]